MAEQVDDYVPQEVTAPVLTGFKLRTFSALIETPFFSAFRSHILRQNGYPQLLDEAHHPEQPLYAPDCDGWPTKRHEWPNVDIPASSNAVDTASHALKSLGGSSVAEEEEQSAVIRYHRAYLSGAATPSQVAERIITALQESDAMSPPMRFLISHDPEKLRSQAAASTLRYASGTPLSVLDGVPFAMKDEADVEGYPTTAGTAFIAKERKPEGTLPGVAALLEAGALLIGKANMHEIGLGTTGLNPVHGTPRNPHDTSHHTGGSSSGSAAIVAAGLAVFAVGADGGGSIRIPSAICGCVGLKTTHSRVCPHPGPQIAYTVGVVGPIAATVRDCAIMYAMLANRGHEQYKMPVPPPVSLPDLSSAALAGAKPLEGVTVGVHWSWFEHAKKPVVDACRRAVGLLEGLGARVRPVVVPNLRELALAHAATITPEMRCAISAYYNNPTLRRQLNAETRISLATGGSFSTGYYIAAQQIRRRADASTRLVFAECDLLATPTVPMLAPPVLPGSESGASDIRTTVSLMRFAQLGNMLGLPGISLPVGSAPAREGGPELPIGLQLMAAPWQEAVLLRTAALLERVLGPAGKPKPSLHWDPLQA